MTVRLRIAILVFALGTGCMAQEGLTVRNNGKHALPMAEAERIYLSACSTVQHEFGGRRPLRPQITLTLGASQNQVEMNFREIRLAKWDSHLFAQGVVILAFEELMPAGDRLTLATRALNWADSTIEIGDLRNSGTMPQGQATAESTEQMLGPRDGDHLQQRKKSF